MHKYILWGTGKQASVIFGTIVNEIILVVDNKEENWGENWNGFEIHSPEVLLEKNIIYDKIIIASAEWRLIRKQLVEELKIDRTKIDNIFFRHREKFLTYYENDPDIEKKRYIEYVKNNPLDVFNGEFTEKYTEIEDEIFFDEDKKLFFTFYKNKKMYFSKKINTREKAERYYKSLLKEQDTVSPHLYQTDEFHVDVGDVVLDAGVAEGNFALEVIDIVDKLYLVEADEEWIEALQYTFEPYSGKVCIIRALLGNDNQITIDEIIGDNRLNFLKMDIEGAELSAIKGGVKTLLRENVKLDICTYHKVNDYNEISKVLENINYKCKPSEGYMIFINHENMMSMEKPELVRGLLRGWKRVCDN